MYELFFEPISEDEQEFRHAYWLLSGYIVREEYIHDRVDNMSSVEVILKEIKDMRDRIQRTECFKSLKADLQRKCLEGKMFKKDLKGRLKAAGFAPKFTKRVYSYLSGYTHSDGFIANQISQAKSENDQKNYIMQFMYIIMMLMSKMILSYKEKFSSSSSLFLANPEVSTLVEKWSDVARRIDEFPDTDNV